MATYLKECCAICDPKKNIIIVYVQLSGKLLMKP